MFPALLPDEGSMRFVAILNRKIEMGRLLNALGHMTAGLAGGYGKGEEMCFLPYKDADGGAHPCISHYPFIVLRADNSSQIAAARAEAIRQNIPYTDFVRTMTVGTSEEQVRSTAATRAADLEYFGICLFGPTDLLKPLTKKFSLFS